MRESSVCYSTSKKKKAVCVSACCKRDGRACGPCGWVCLGVLFLLHFIHVDPGLRAEWKTTHAVMRLAGDSAALHHHPIPQKIHQTFSSVSWGQLPSLYRANSAFIATMNPDMDYRYWSDANAEELIAEQFAPDVLTSFRTLIPGALKADLFRLCVLYVHGGFYIDFDYRTRAPLKDILRRFPDIDFAVPLDKPQLCVWPCVWQGIMISRPGHPILMDAIRRIVANVQARDYTCSALHISGPGLMGRVIWDALGLAAGQTAHADRPCGRPFEDLCRVHHTAAAWAQNNTTNTQWGLLLMSYPIDPPDLSYRGALWTSSYFEPKYPTSKDYLLDFLDKAVNGPRLIDRNKVDYGAAWAARNVFSSQRNSTDWSRTPCVGDNQG